MPNMQKSKPVVMSTCPYCGVPLTETLRLAVLDPTQDESCPRDSSPMIGSARRVETASASKRLAALMLLGSGALLRETKR